jgi:nitric oxide reductase activation protein
MANRDGHALKYINKRLNELANTDKKVIILINDGNPNASTPSGYSNISYTRECVKEVEKEGTQVIQVAITEEVESSKMFTNYVKFTNMNSLAKNFGELVEKVLNQNL